MEAFRYDRRDGGLAWHISRGLHLGNFPEATFDKALFNQLFLSKYTPISTAPHIAMACSTCSRRALELFVKGAAGIDMITSPHAFLRLSLQQSRTFNTGARLRIPRSREQLSPSPPSSALTLRCRTNRSKSKTPPKLEGSATEPSPRTARFSNRESSKDQDRKNTSVASKATSVSLDSGFAVKAASVKREQWQIQKAALQEKFGSEKWNPRKRLSPDALDGIRALHAKFPDKFTTPLLAEQFKVSPDAIRRILKSKWKPSEEEQEDRMQRWDKRGETIWSNLVEMGVKPPKKWREMGVGRAKKGDVPKWKTRWRNQVAVNSSTGDEFVSIVDEGPGYSAWEDRSRISDRIL